MFDHSSTAFARRALLAGGAAALATAGYHAARAQVTTITTDAIRLTATPGNLLLVGTRHLETAVWSYGGQVPGPEIRLRQGSRLRATLENRLPEDTTIHWHGLRVPNAMDGVPHLTQAPVPPGGSFSYAFDVADAGTYWYHPHQRGFEQVARGLSGALIVEEAEPPPTIDRDVTWVLADWRLMPDAQIAGGFGNAMDAGMAGRIGNTVTVNGKVPDEPFAVRAGERLRLRLINTATARVFGLEFERHAPVIIALNGQPVDPHEPKDGRVVLGPGMRADLVIDMKGRPGNRMRVLDTFYARLAYRLTDIAYGPEALRDRPQAAPVPALPANPLPQPDLATAERQDVLLGGGMMSGMGAGGMMGGGMMDGGMMRQGLVWTINGVASASGPRMHDPMTILRRGGSYVLALRNETAWWHPMHLHGHTFRVLSRNGVADPHREWGDTILIPPRETAEIAFVADNPGDWMFHCHVLDHQAAGMMGVVRVA